MDKSVVSQEVPQLEVWQMNLIRDLQESNHLDTCEGL